MLLKTPVGQEQKLIDAGVPIIYTGSAQANALETNHPRLVHWGGFALADAGLRFHSGAAEIPCLSRIMMEVTLDKIVHDIARSAFAPATCCLSTAPSNPSDTWLARGGGRESAGGSRRTAWHGFRPDVQLRPASMGSKNHAFRRRRGHRSVSTSPRAQRSLQCTHAVSADRASAADILADHENTHPFAVDSPIGKLWKLNAWVLLLGCGHNSSSTIHVAEEAEDVPYLYRTRIQYILAGDQKFDVEVRRPGRSNGFYKIDTPLRGATRSSTEKSARPTAC